MTYNAANRKDVRRAEKQARIDFHARLEMTRTLMSTTTGRQWMYELLNDCHVFISSFNPSAPDMAFAEGKRLIGLRLFNEVTEAAPDQYVMMMREANVRHSTADARERTDSEDGDGGDQEPDSFADSPDAA